MIDASTFAKCSSCTAKVLCAACLHNRASIKRLRTENEALTKVYGIAACMRTFPVPFNDHYQLVGAVDECRSVLEPPIDNYAPQQPQKRKP